MKRLSAVFALLVGGLLLMGADGCSSDPNVEGAKLDLRNKDYARALENLEIAISKDPANAEALELKGRVLSEMAFASMSVDENVQLIGEMIDAFDAALAVDATLRETITRSMAIAYVNEFQRGIQAFNRGQNDTAEFDAAATYFGAASTIQPDSGGAYVNQAYALMNAGRNADAIEPFEKAIERGDSEIDTYRFLASLYQTNGRAADAVTVLENVSQMYPNNPDVQAELLNAYQVAGMADRALQVYEDAVESDPENKLYRYNFGSLLVAAERYDEAIVQLEKAVEIDPEYGNAQYNLGAAYINKAVDVNNRINELDDNLRSNRDSMSASDIAAAEAEIDRLADERRSLFGAAVGPLERARVLFESEGESSTAVCQALYQSYVQTNQLDMAQGIASCAGYEDN